MRLGLVLLCIALLSLHRDAHGQTANDSLPEFIAVLDAPSTGVLFALRWRNHGGATVQAWRRMGDRIGDDFTLIDYDRTGEAVLLKGRDGRVHRVALPESRVVSGMTLEEFKHLCSFLPAQANAGKAAPVLSREKARAFWLRLLADNPVPPDPELVLDFAGTSLSPEKQAEFQQARARAKKEGNLIVLEVRNDGDQHGNTIPINTFGLPESMTQSLLEADWDELSHLTAAWMIRARTLSGKKATKK